MLNLNTIDFNAPVRQIVAKVELFKDGSTQAITIPHYGDLQSITVERTGESKFFGFGVCAKANIKLIDKERAYNLTTSDSFKIYFDDVCALPQMYITEVHRDENTNGLSITVYDAIQKAAQHTVSEITATSYTLGQFATLCGVLLGVNVIIPDFPEFQLSYENGANFDGNETIRAALNAIAEITQTIYYIDTNNNLAFKRLDKDGEPALTIDKEKYIELKESENRRLVAVCSATELGDNIESKLEVSGTTQYIRNNPFLDLREDRAELVENALAAVGGLTIGQFDCNWRGNYLLEIGDKIGLVNKDNSTTYSYFLTDKITYDGTYSQSTSWKYQEGDKTAANPSNLGDVLKQTYAKVDKANKTVEIVANETSENTNKISMLELNTKSINATVEELSNYTDAALNGVTDTIVELDKRVQATITPEELSVEISNVVKNGVEKVTTSTGFSFDENGLTVSKSNSEMKTLITEDGMTIYRGSTAVLTANNVGVDDKDLHATTYLIIGDNCRFEDYGSSRTGCFWIGG